MLTVEGIRAAVSRLADVYPIKKISLFGSYADGTASETSDVDLLVEFSTPNVSLLTLAGIKGKMEEELQKEVDVVHGPLFNESLLKLNKVIELYEQ